MTGRQRWLVVRPRRLRRPAVHPTDRTTSRRVFEELNAGGTTSPTVTHEREIAEHATLIVHLLDGEVETATLRNL